MKKPLLIVIIVVGIIAASGIFIAAGNRSSNTTGMNMEQTTTTTPSSSTQPNSITIQNYQFSPSPMIIKKGTTVTWTNQDTAKHTIEMDKDQPTGGPADSPLLAKGESYSFTFNTVGTFKYHCGPHPYMMATVKVSE